MEAMDRAGALLLAMDDFPFEVESAYTLFPPPCWRYVSSLQFIRVAQSGD